MMCTSGLPILSLSISRHGPTICITVIVMADSRADIPYMYFVQYYLTCRKHYDRIVPASRGDDCKPWWGTESYIHTPRIGYTRESDFFPST